VLRWATAAFLEAAKHIRRIRSYRDLWGVGVALGREKSTVPVDRQANTAEPMRALPPSGESRRPSRPGAILRQVNVKKNKSRLWQILLVTLVVLPACNDTFIKEKYTCKVNGYNYRYRNGVQIKEDIPGNIEFSLTTFPRQNYYEINADGFFLEHKNKDVVLDKNKSNSVEAVYISDKTDSQSKFRTVTSLVLNQVSGDIRVFHHRWIPPNEWKNSDLYFFTGNCRKK
jgi:hypothetical protein